MHRPGQSSRQSGAIGSASDDGLPDERLELELVMVRQASDVRLEPSDRPAGPVAKSMLGRTSSRDPELERDLEVDEAAAARAGDRRPRAAR